METKIQWNGPQYNSQDGMFSIKLDSDREDPFGLFFYEAELGRFESFALAEEAAERFAEQTPDCKIDKLVDVVFSLAQIIEDRSLSDFHNVCESPDSVQKMHNEMKPVLAARELLKRLGK